jgi:dTDP-4-dehydrorhamnose reductase
MNNIVLIGSSGYISSFLLEDFKKRPPEKTNILTISRDLQSTFFLDLRYPDRFNYSILKKDDYIIFTAAVSSPDVCSQEYDLCWTINVTGTSYFIKKALDVGCRILFFSSDAVFSGNIELVCTEKTKAIATTPYGKMKKMIEDEFCSNPCFRAIRFSYIISAKDKFISYCIKCVQNNKNAEIFHPFYRNCISIQDVVHTIRWLISNWDNYHFAFLNVAGPELVSRIRIADELNRIFNNKLKYNVVLPSKEFYKNRPAIIQMKSVYFNDNRIINDVSFSEKVYDAVKEIVL